MPFRVPPDARVSAVVRDRFDADPMAVRAALMRLERGPLLAPLDQGHRDCVLLVLAEVLNNVAEHAYGGAPGPVTLSLWREGGAVSLRVADRGGVAPTPAAAQPCRAEALPEGGFGLGLIRALSRDIRLRRRNGCNVLTLRIPCDNPDRSRAFVSNPLGRSQKKPDFPLNPPPAPPISMV